MALLHATLTEDESVLLEALEPGPDDSCLALFAKGNGDAALALVAAGARLAEVHDRFDQAGLEAQLAFKKRLISTLSPDDLRRYMGLDPGFEPGVRARFTEILFDDLPLEAGRYWHARRDLLARGMVNSDQTREFGQLLARVTPWVDSLRQYPSLLHHLLRLILVASPLFYPAPERLHSLGYRQLREDPLPALDRLLDRAGECHDGDFVGASRMAYLLPAGLGRLRTRLDAIRPIAVLGAGPYRKVYLSNLIDWLSARDFGDLLGTILDRCEPGARLFVNSTRRSDEDHPSLIPALRAARLVVDTATTRRLRRRDRLGVYPGLSVLSRA